MIYLVSFFLATFLPSLYPFLDLCLLPFFRQFCFYMFLNLVVTTIQNMRRGAYCYFNHHITNISEIIQRQQHFWNRTFCYLVSLQTIFKPLWAQANNITDIRLGFMQCRLWIYCKANISRVSQYIENVTS